MNAETAGASGPPSLAELSTEHFRPLLHQAFVLHLPEGGTLDLRLSEVSPARAAPAAGARPGFSILFQCPELPQDQSIRQGSYRIEHPSLGSHEIFIVPVMPDAAGVRYEAVFN